MTYNCTIEKPDDWYIAQFPDMPNIMTCDKTFNGVLKMAEEALNGCLEVCVDDNLPIAEPKFSEGYPIVVEPKIAFAIELRNARGNRTQKEIANLVGMSYQQYQRLENPRKTNPTLETLFKLQKAVGRSFLCL